MFYVDSNINVPELLKELSQVIVKETDAEGLIAYLGKVKISLEEYSETALSDVNKIEEYALLEEYAEILETELSEVHGFTIIDPIESFVDEMRVNYDQVAEVIYGLDTEALSTLAVTLESPVKKSSDRYSPLRELCYEVLKLHISQISLMDIIGSIELYKNAVESQPELQGILKLLCEDLKTRGGSSN